MFTKNELKIYRVEMENALKGFAEKYNFDIKAGNISYDSNSFNIKIEVRQKEINGKSFEQAEFESLCVLFDFKPEDYGKKFNYNGRMFSLTGFNTKAHKMPILATSEGKTYKFAPDTIKKLIG